MVFGFSQSSCYFDAVYLKRDGGCGGMLPSNIFGGHISVCRQRIYRHAKGKGAVVLNH